MTTALAPTTDERKGSALAAFEPQNFEQLMKFSEWISKSGLIPKALQGKPHDIAIVIMKGKDLNISSMQALGGINVIDGKAVVSAELMIGLVKRVPSVCEYLRCKETTEKSATWVAKRRGAEDETSLTYTLDDAAKAGLLGKNNWKGHPKAMLRWRAGAGLARAEFPELTMNMLTDDEALEAKLDAIPEQLEEHKSKTKALEERVAARLGKKPAVIDVPAGMTEEQASARAMTPDDFPGSDFPEEVGANG